MGSLRPIDPCPGIDFARWQRTGKDYTEGIPIKRYLH